MSRSAILRLILICSFAFCAGCGPALLKKRKFTPKAVKSLFFSDECKLQGYFNKGPTYKAETVQVVSSKGFVNAGHIIFLVSKKKDLDVFIDLVNRLYKRVPDLTKLGPLRVMARYQERQKRRSFPIGANIEIEYGKKEKTIELPYHPCLGGYFYGKDHYRIRARLLGGS